MALSDCDQHSPHSEAEVADVRLELGSRDDTPWSLWVWPLRILTYSRAWHFLLAFG